MKSSVLILCSFSRDARKFARMIEDENTEAIVAQSISDALGQLASRPFDMLISESQIGQSSGLTLLAESRKRLPSMLRIIVETSPINSSMYSVINDVAPAAIYRNSIDQEKVKEMLAAHAAERQARAGGGAAIPSPTRESKQGPSDAEQAGEETDKTEAAPEEEAELEKLMTGLREILEAEETALPVLPQMAGRVRNVMSDESNSFEEVAEIVELDQGMAARILQVANSPIYAGLERIRNLADAVGRLGMRETQNILLAVIAENMFKSENKNLQLLLKQLWLHSLCVAYSNENIAKRLEIEDSRDYFMYGLLHDIGKLLIIQLLHQGAIQKRWSLDRFPVSTIQRLFDQQHNVMGHALMEKWDYPKQFRDVVLHHNDEANIEIHSEPVIATFFSNLISRKVGFSFASYDGDPAFDLMLRRALNISSELQQELENQLRDTTHKIRRSCFNE